MKKYLWVFLVISPLCNSSVLRGPTLCYYEFSYNKKISVSEYFNEHQDCDYITRLSFVSYHGGIKNQDKEYFLEKGILDKAVLINSAYEILKNRKYINEKKIEVLKEESVVNFLPSVEERRLKISLYIGRNDCEECGKVVLIIEVVPSLAIVSRASETYGLIFKRRIEVFDFQGKEDLRNKTKKYLDDLINDNYFEGLL